MHHMLRVIVLLFVCPFLATEEGSNLPATEEGSNLPATEEGSNLPATEEGSNLPATEEGSNLLATEEGSNLSGMEEGEERGTRAAVGEKRGSRGEDVPIAKRLKGRCAAPEKGKWRVGCHGEDVSSGQTTTSSDEVYTCCSISSELSEEYARALEVKHNIKTE